MSTHTPGPWRVDQPGRECGVEGARGEPVCAMLFNASNGVPLEASKANARLIAAAPELFDALCKMQVAFRQAYKAGGFYNSEVWADEIYAVSQAAIAKATR